MGQQYPQGTRRYDRAPAEHQVRIRVRSDRQPDRVSRTRIISPGGCMLVSEDPLGPGSLLELIISLDDHLLLTEARVAWEKPGPGEHQVGIEFLRIHPKDRELLTRLVARKLGSAA